MLWLCLILKGRFSPSKIKHDLRSKGNGKFLSLFHFSCSSFLSSFLKPVIDRLSLNLQRDNQFVKSLNGAPSIAGLSIVYLCCHHSWGFVIWNVFWKSIKVALSDIIELEKCGRSKETVSLRCWGEEWVSKGWRLILLRGACFTSAGSSFVWVPRVLVGLVFPGSVVPLC